MSGHNFTTWSILDYYIYGLYEIHDPSGSMLEDEYQACKELWTAQFFGWLESERARIWDEGAAAGWQNNEYESGFSDGPKILNPYRAKEDA